MSEKSGDQRGDPVGIVIHSSNGGYVVRFPLIVRHDR